jgi:predicted GIY-YIG superfamily endonuclease
MKGTVYLLHFSEPYKHAKHYIGYTRDLSARLESHANGTGARLLEVVTQAGITFNLARTWKGTRKTERRIKRHGGASRICPMCNPQAMRRAKAIN